MFCASAAGTKPTRANARTAQGAQRLAIGIVFPFLVPITVNVVLVMLFSCFELSGLAVSWNTTFLFKRWPCKWRLHAVVQPNHAVNLLIKLFPVDGLRNVTIHARCQAVFLIPLHRVRGHGNDREMKSC